jgi:hypothetical protein
MQTDVHLWQYLAEFFLEWQTLHTKFVQKIKTRFILNHFFFPKVAASWDDVEKYCTTTLATDDNIIRRKCIVCWTTKTADTPTEYATITDFPQQKLLWKAPHRYVLWTKSPALCFHCILSKVRPQLDKPKGATVIQFIHNCEKPSNRLFMLGFFLQSPRDIIRDLLSDWFHASTRARTHTHTHTHTHNYFSVLLRMTLKTMPVSKIIQCPW